MAEKHSRVCVTGAGGYVAFMAHQASPLSWLHRSWHPPKSSYAAGDEKYANLKKLDNAAEHLKIFKADLLDFDSILATVKGCIGVFHVASPVPESPVPNPEVELVQPALNGTLNVLKACSEAKIGRVVIVSSVAAVSMIPDWPKDQVMDENCWSDKEYCRETNNWYCYSKTVAEAEAWEYAKKNGLNIITVCPSLVLGPMLQHTANASSLVLIKMLTESYEEIENNTRKIVDVRDVAEALRKPEAEGRYICMAHMINNEDLMNMLKTFYPNYDYPNSWYYETWYFKRAILQSSKDRLP